MEKNIYKITFKKVDYDETRGIIVVARDKAEAELLCLGDYNKTKDNIDEFVLIGKAKNNLKKGIILEDFNAG